MKHNTLIHTLKRATPLLAAAFGGAFLTFVVLHRDDILQAIRDRRKAQ